jgi:subtilisin family serine protease
MLSSLLALGLLMSVPLQVAPDKLVPELRAAFLASDEARVYRVYAVLEERLAGVDFEGQVEGLARGERQAFVAQRLRSFAEPRQAGLLAQLESLREAGAVERVRALWINNTVVFHGTAAAIEAVAQRPEVRSVGWDPVRPASEYQDDQGTSDGGGFTTYYTQDFEGGVLPVQWQTSVTGCGDVSVTNLHGPQEGSFHIVMASTTDNCTGTASLTLKVNLTAATSASVRYGFKDMNDEFNAGLDILEASDDGGATWAKVADLTGQDGGYLTKTHDLDSLGLTYVSDFLIRWSWSDNFTPETDGFGIDDVEIASGFEPPPPPGPQPNLVSLQAPDLWDLGIKGGGVRLLNIDSGADYNHPDLVNRIWSNPNDAADGIDNDGNGFIDDTLGWDFAANDNDPNTSATHGTNTSGIMVGDGSAGLFLTGMAPEASLAIALVSGETDHWAAQQWGISVGMDCSSSSHSYKWYFSPKPDYHMHRAVEEIVLAAGIIHANSIGNDGGSSSAPVPFNISAPGLTPPPWKHPAQTQPLARRAGAVMACGGILLDESHYSPSGSGPVPWEDLLTYDPAYPHSQNAAYFDYPVGGFGGTGQGLIKPDVCTVTNVVTTTNGGGYNSSFGGTSAATPHLGGALALLLSAQPNAAPRHVAQALQVTAKDLGAPGKDNVFGAGKVQVRDAALRLLGLVKSNKLAPSLGAPVTFTTYGQAGEFFATMWSLSLGSTPFVGGLLDLGTPFSFLQTGVLLPGGNSVMVTVPTNSALVGVSVHFQTVQDDTGGLTGQILFSTVESVTIRN